MKKIIILVTLVSFFASCSKESLELYNPNEPGTESLATEEGIQKAAYGVYNPMRDSDDYYYYWFVLTNHNIMGDVTTVSAGNFGWRYVNQVASITRPNGVVVTPPVGGTQVKMLEQFNSRDQGNNNPSAHEWVPMYGVIGHTNLMLSVLDDVQFTGTASEIATKKNTYKAWFLWWKAFAYSRIGSIYSKGLITDQYNKLVGNYVSNAEVLAEAKKVFTEAKNILSTINESDDTYKEIMNSLIPSHLKSGNGGFISPGMFVRNINSYLARNILVNKYASELTQAELTEVEMLTNEGIKATDKIFTVRSNADDDLCLVYTTAWSPYRLLAGWENISERLVQDFKNGDNRFERNIALRGSAIYNPRGRGLSYGTRYQAVDGGDYASSTAGSVEIPIACSYEENQLMLAEVKIRNNNVNDGLTHIDAVRNYQNAQLPNVSGMGLTKEQALEELRKERRVGLFQKGVAFYDARRWGILKPVAQGGGRQNANVVVDGNGTVEPCTIDYTYKEWFDVPAQETDFNPVSK
ncbi:RagB/SusD family nutrient uptake outer membrane protein [Capnocytophaga canimorsus]|uniref:RagB/SusD family nutrient uptake outer membrane protein n=1 Tax=Capnocytophaga canimorsus TaxID=28188 RepID=UPI001EDEEFCB|nr:RagB/SusD family nutrient uptake outer membrane protein [Capnocytophaga canimorsus]